MTLQARAYLAGFKPLEFGYTVTQEHAHAWLTGAFRRMKHSKNKDEINNAIWLCDRLVSTSQIKTRVVSIPDMTHTDWPVMTMFREEKRPGGEAIVQGAVPLERRMEIFADQTDSLVTQAFEGEAVPPDYAIQLSCTGYDAPAAMQKFLCRRSWQDKSRFLNIGHMGCSAAIPSTTAAINLLPAWRNGDPAARVSMVMMELPSLHFRIDVAPEQIVQQFLFADGAIRVDALAEPASKSLAFIDSFETIVPGTDSYMTWRAADSVFNMHLGREIADVIGSRLRNVVEAFLGRNGLRVADIGRFALHPGGPKIIEKASQSLGLPESAVAHSLQVLRNRGNMSSTTLPHIWHSMIEDPDVRDGELICSLAFGPGLTIVCNLLRKVG